MKIQQTAPTTARRGTAASRRVRSITTSAAGGAALALALAACGGASSAGGSAYGDPPTPSTSPTASAVNLRTSADGRILVDGQGRTLYLFEADKAGKSACTGGCASVWPPYLGNGTPGAGNGVTRTLLGTSSRPEGGQVTYGGHPLYYYVGDKAPGDVSGQGLDQFGAKWYVLGQNGNKIDDD